MAGYRLDAKAFQEHLLNADWMVAEMRARAEQGKEFAEAISPFRAGDFADEYRHYKESFEVASGKHGPDDEGREKKERAWARLSNTSDHAAEVEWGNGAGWHGDHVLTQAMDVMGA